MERSSLHLVLTRVSPLDTQGNDPLHILYRCFLPVPSSMLHDGARRTRDSGTGALVQLKLGPFADWTSNIDQGQQMQLC